MIDFGIKDAIDILLVGGLLYLIYNLMKRTGSVSAFIGVLVFILAWLLVTHVFEMRLMGSIFDKLVSVGVIALIVLFQAEIRRFLFTIGSQQNLSFLKFFVHVKKENNESQDWIEEIVTACYNMSRQYVGALIVIQKRSSIDDIIATGLQIDAIISDRLIENIFVKNSPLHDGAMVISNNQIKAAGCSLPISSSVDIPKSFGFRHRAALGMSQESDAITLICSEETGNVMLAKNGKVSHPLTREQLLKKLNYIFEVEDLNEANIGETPIIEKKEA